MAGSGGDIFRQKALDRLSSPDELTDYLKVTNPSVWAVLIAIAVLLAGIFAWACIGTLQTKAEAEVVVQNDVATILVADPYLAREGMIVTVSGQEHVIDSTAVDKSGKTIGHARVALPDGTYDGVAVVDETRAIDFLLKSS